MKWQLIGNIAGKKGSDGKDAEPVDNDAIVNAVLERIPPTKNGVDGKDGKDIDQETVRAIISDEVAKAVGVVFSEIHIPKDGADGRDGKDADPEVLAALVSKTVDSMLPALLAKAIEVASPDLIAKTVSLIPRPADGRDGRDGAPGIPGRDGTDGVDAVGQKGADGRDGLSLDDLDATLKDDGRTIVLSLRNGDREITREIKLAVPVYKEIYRQGMYEKGDSVTYAGSLWIALKDTELSPGGSNSDWRLAVKAGKSGKSAT